MSDKLTEMGEKIQGPFGMMMAKLGPGSLLLGSDKGALPYGSERPRHEVKISERWISTELVTRGIWAEAMGEECEGEENEPVEHKSWGEIEDFVKRVKNATTDKFEGEWRLPSESEWEFAHTELGISVPPALEELFSDHPHPNHRGAPTDGRPRMDGNPNSMMRLYRISRKAHPYKIGFSVKSQTPVKHGQDGIVFRLIFIPQKNTPGETGDCLFVPDEIDAGRLFKREAIIALIIGIIPSFSIPIIRGFSSYAVEGWVNLLFGGLLISLASSVIWRPRTETWVFTDDGKSMERRWLSGEDL